MYIIREEPVEVESTPVEAEPQVVSKEDDLATPVASTAPSSVQESVSAPLADSPLPVSTLPENLPLRKNKGKKYQEKKYQDSLPSHSPIHPIYPYSREKFVGILEWNSCLSKYKRQVEYDTLLFDHPEWKERLDELLELMTEASCCPAPTQRIGGCQVSTEVVRARYGKIDMFIMDYIFDKLSTTIQPIRNIRQYLRTVLFHAPSTCTHEYDARVRWDFHGQN